MVHQHVIVFLHFPILYLSSSQIWLNPLVADHHFRSTMRRLKYKEKHYWLGVGIRISKFIGRGGLSSNSIISAS